MRKIDPFEPFKGWQDTDYLKSEVERAFAHGAHVTVETLRRALRRVVADGIHGPIGDREWEEMDGKRMPMKKAVEIVRAAQGAELPAIYVSSPDVGVVCGGAGECEHQDHRELSDDGPLFHEEPIEMDRQALLDWYFRDLIPIYGWSEL